MSRSGRTEGGSACGRWLGCLTGCIVAVAAIAGPNKDLKGFLPDDVRTIGIVSASYPLSKDKLDLGTNLLVKAGYRVKVMPNVLKQVKPAERARLFEQAWLDPEIDFLLFSCGGHGASDVIGAIDWEKLKSRKMRVMGFSDVTLILNSMLAKGVGHPISGPMVSTLVSYCSQESLARLRQVLDGQPPPLSLTPIGNCAAPAVGRPLGGLLSRFPVLEKAGLLPSFDGRVVFIECTPKYADDSGKMLDGLCGKGLFDRAAAVVFCDFNRKWEKPRVDALIAGFAAKVKCPVFSGYPYGHVGRSYAFDFTRPLTIKPDGTLIWSER